MCQACSASFSRRPCPLKWVWRKIFFSLSASKIKATCFSINGEEFDGFDCVNNVVPGKHGYTNIGFPRDKITEGASNELGIHVVICDNSGQNMAFVKEIKDLRIVTVTVDK